MCVCRNLDFCPLLSSPVFSSTSPPVGAPIPLLSTACNDLVASGRDRKPNALVQVSVIDPHKQHLVSHSCTEIVEVRQQPCIPSLRLSDLRCFTIPLGDCVLVGVLSSLPSFCSNLFSPHVTYQTMRVNLFLMKLQWENFCVASLWSVSMWSVCGFCCVRVPYSKSVLCSLTSLDAYFITFSVTVLLLRQQSHVLFERQQLPLVSLWNTHLYIHKLFFSFRTWGQSFVTHKMETILFSW